MNETVKKLQKFIIEELTRVRGQQWKLNIDNDMFHFYNGYAMSLKDVLDELCRLEGVREENERKEVK